MNEHLPIHLLIVDDAWDLAATMQDVFRADGITSVIAESVPEALQIIDIQGPSFDGALIDKGARADPGLIGHRGGLDVVSELRAVNPAARIVVWSGEGTFDPVLLEEATAFSRKPAEPFFLAEYFLQGPDYERGPVQNISGYPSLDAWMLNRE